MKKIWVYLGVVLAIVTVLFASCVEVAPSPVSEPTPAPAQSSTTATPTPESVPMVSVEEVKHKLESGYSFILVDVRSKAAFAVTHISGAVSIPLEELPGRYMEIPQDSEVVVYSQCA